MATGGAGTGGSLAFDATASGSMDLTAVEVVRVSAVLEDTLEKLSFLSAITPDVVMHKEEAAELTSGEVSRLIAEQHALERKYEDLVAQRALLKGAGNKARFKALQEEIQSVYYQVRESMKGVCRTLRENPDVSENLARIAEEREALASLLEKTLSDLRDGHYRSLASFVSKEREARAKMRAAVNKEEEVLREVDRLTTTLKEEEERHAADMEARRLEQAELKERLRKLKIDTTLTLRYTRKEAAATTDSAARAHTAAEMAVVDEIEAIRKRSETERRVHDQTMDALRRGGWRRCSAAEPRRPLRAAVHLSVARHNSHHRHYSVIPCACAAAVHHVQTRRTLQNRRTTGEQSSSPTSLAQRLSWRA